VPKNIQKLKTKMIYELKCYWSVCNMFIKYEVQIWLVWSDH